MKRLLLLFLLAIALVLAWQESCDGTGAGGDARVHGRYGKGEPLGALDTDLESAPSPALSEQSAQ